MSDRKPKRPAYLNLLRIRLPVGGVVSILHRVTGTLLVLLLPLFLYLLQRSLTDPDAFAQIAATFGSPAGRVAVFVVTLMLAHHFFAGIRHLLLDIDIGIGRIASRRGAWLVLASVGIVAIIAGGRLLK